MAPPHRPADADADRRRLERAADRRRLTDELDRLGRAIDEQPTASPERLALLRQQAGISDELAYLRNGRR